MTKHDHCAAPPPRTPLPRPSPIPRCIYARYLNAARYQRHTDMPDIWTLLSTQQVQICQIPGCCSVPNRYRYARYLCCNVPMRYRCARYMDAAAYSTDTDMTHTWFLQYTQQIQIWHIPGFCSILNRYRYDTYLVSAAYSTDTDMAHTWMLQHTQQIQTWHIPGCCSVINRYRYGTYLNAAAYSTDADMAHTWMLQRTEQIQIQN